MKRTISPLPSGGDEKEITPNENAQAPTVEAVHTEPNRNLPAEITVRAAGKVVADAHTTQAEPTTTNVVSLFESRPVQQDALFEPSPLPPDPRILEIICREIMSGNSVLEKRPRAKTSLRTVATVRGTMGSMGLPDDGSEKRTIGRTAREAILAGFSNEEVVELILLDFPYSRVKPGGVSHYRSILLAIGEDV